MTQALYSANPSVWRMRPFGTLIAWLLVLLGGYIAAMGEIPYAQELLAGIELPDLPAWADPRYLGYLLIAWGLLQLVSWWVSARFDRLEITGKELVWTHGFLNKQYTETNMHSVRTVRVRQSLLQRLLNAGDIVIYTTGDDPELTIRGLPRPGEIRSLIKQQTSEA
jgi:membrane protein YdbS with pleckstrin-like domain